MPRHHPERLDVHHEPVRRALRPALHHLLGGEPVVRGVDLDRVEVLRVPGEPRPGGDAFRVPELRERLVRPRARADPDRRRHALRLAEPVSASRLVPRPRLRRPPETGRRPGGLVALSGAQLRPHRAVSDVWQLRSRAGTGGSTRKPPVPEPSYLFLRAVTTLTAKNESEAVLQPCGTVGNGGAGHDWRSPRKSTWPMRRVFFLILIRIVNLPLAFVLPLPMRLSLPGL